MRLGHPELMPPRIDIRNFRQEYCDTGVTLASDSLEVGGELVDIQVRVATYYPTTTNPFGGGEDPTGRRTMLGIFASTGGATQLVQHLPGPSEFSRYGSYDSELQQERKILELLEQQPASSTQPSHARLGSAVTPLARAHQTKEAVYKSTAPGILLRSAIGAIAESYALGELSDDAVALLLAKAHGSALSSLAGLHSHGIRHHHPHIDNFNIDIRSGAATIFDYTLAVSKYARDTEVRVDSGILTGDNPEQDFQEFEVSWTEAIEKAGLSKLDSLLSSDTPETDGAIGLETIVIRNVLRGLGVANVTDRDVWRVIALQEELIGIAPDIYYPKDTIGQRLRTRLAAARIAVREFLST